MTDVIFTLILCVSGIIIPLVLALLLQEKLIKRQINAEAESYERYKKEMLVTKFRIIGQVQKQKMIEQNKRREKQMTEVEFMNQIRNSSDEELKTLARDCNICASRGVWDKEGRMYSLLNTYAASNDGEFPNAMPVIINVAIEFMRRNA